MFLFVKDTSVYVCVWRGEKNAWPFVRPNWMIFLSFCQKTRRTNSFKDRGGIEFFFRVEKAFSFLWPAWWCCYGLRFPIQSAPVFTYRRLVTWRVCFDGSPTAIPIYGNCTRRHVRWPVGSNKLDHTWRESCVGRLFIYGSPICVISLWRRID